MLGIFVLKEDKHLLQPPHLRAQLIQFDLSLYSFSELLFFFPLHHPALAPSTQSHPCSPVLACKRTLLFCLTFIFLSTAV